VKELQYWWQSLVDTERKVVAALVVLVVLVLFQSMIWAPLHEGRKNAMNSVEKQAELLQWMRQRAALASMLKPQGVAAPKAGAHSMSRHINAMAKQAKIDVNRFETARDGSVQIWLDKVEFSALLLWLEALQKSHGIQVESIVVGETGQSGLISVRATLVSM